MRFVTSTLHHAQDKKILLNPLKSFWGEQSKTVKGLWRIMCRKGFEPSFLTLKPPLLPPLQHLTDINIIMSYRRGYADEGGGTKLLLLSRAWLSEQDFTDTFPGMFINVQPIRGREQEECTEMLQDGPTFDPQHSLPDKAVTTDRFDWVAAVNMKDRKFRWDWGRLLSWRCLTGRCGSVTTHDSKC